MPVTRHASLLPVPREPDARDKTREPDARAVWCVVLYCIVLYQRSRLPASQRDFSLQFRGAEYDRMLLSKGELFCGSAAFQFSGSTVDRD
jgi:hypothetical protein